MNALCVFFNTHNRLWTGLWIIQHSTVRGILSYPPVIFQCNKNPKTGQIFYIPSAKHFDTSS